MILPVPVGQALGESWLASVVAATCFNREKHLSEGTHTSRALGSQFSFLSLSPLTASSCYKLVLDTFIILLLNADTIL